MIAPNYPRVQTFDWYLIYIGADEENKEPKEVAVSGRISTKKRGVNKLKKEVMRHLKINEDVLVIFQYKRIK